MPNIITLSASLAKDLLALSGPPGARRISRRLSISFKYCNVIMWNLNRNVRVSSSVSTLLSEAAIW